jgi:hypothetical protein
MLTTKVAAAAALLVVLGGTAACGSSDSSSSSGAAGAPTDASKSEFCSTISAVTDSTTPHQLADAFQKVGTPSDIDDGSRHGFEVLVDAIAALPDETKSSDLTAAAVTKDMSAADKKDFAAFGAYLAHECVPAGTPTAPSS